MTRRALFKAGWIIACYFGFRWVVDSQHLTTNDAYSFGWIAGITAVFWVATPRLGKL